MNLNRLVITFAIVTLILGTTAGILNLVAVHATGGAGEIKSLIDPIIDRAIAALEQGNIELALEEIQTLKDELNDTFEADKEE